MQILKSVKNLVILMAMADEAQPIIGQLSLTEKISETPLLPMKIFHGHFNEKNIHIIVNGADPEHKVDCIGTVPASLSTFMAMQQFNPDLIINAGTAGGFKSQGANIGDIYLANKVQFHDHRITIPGFKGFGINESNINIQFNSLSLENLSNKLNFKIGAISTGDSLDMSSEDKNSMETYGACLKDMEAAGILWVSKLYNKPTLFLKSVTDIVDDQHPTADEFLKNLKMASENLSLALIKLIKCL
ncbi:MAG: 5'-methylthioadenosine nucleosidase [Bdellovibrionaceae bacterium]|nr:5'-methylthioadenosine nucleosidase [Pseudobdellovibrionaceae bacterium]